MVIFNISEKDRDKALKLSLQTGLEIVDKVPDQFYLVYENDSLFVKDQSQGPQFKLNIDVEKTWARLKSQRISYKKDLLSRAVGFKGQEDYCVFDGTLGFAKDALHLLSLGCSLIGVEKSPIVYALVEDALSHNDKISEKILIFQGDTFDHLQNHHNEIDCLYLDPMFEDVKKKSAPKKEMAFLRALHTSNDDVQRVMGKAFELGLKRVVVKRPINGENLFRKPNHTHEGKLIRFDVYTK